MKLETFFEKFELFADVPDSVAKMRELILSLAVQGRLIQQDDSEQPVGELLTKNDAERQKVARNDRRAKEQRQTILSVDEQWTIPRSWAWRGLADLVLFVDYRGKTPKKISNGVRLITAKNVRKGHVNLFPEEFVSDTDYKAWMVRGIPKVADVLFTTEAPLGNAAVIDLAEKFALAQRVICFQNYGALDSQFLVYQILSKKFQNVLYKNGTGMTAKGIKAAKLKKLPIAVPPLAEQKRIVARVDELMALCDRLEAQQKERDARRATLARASLARFADAPTPANLNLLFHQSYHIDPADLRKSILTLAIQGKLVLQDPSENVRHDFPLWGKEGIKKVKRVTPGHWLEIEFGKVGEWRGGGTPSKAESDYWGGEIPWVCPKDMKRPIITESIDQITEKAVDSSSAKYIPEGSVLMVVRGMILARAFPVAIAGCKLTINQDMKSVSPVYSETRQYLYLALCALQKEFLKVVERSGHGTCKLRTKNLHAISIPIPPLGEQHRIVARVDQLMALVDELESQLFASRDTARKLLDALIAELTAAGAPVPECVPG